MKNIVLFFLLTCVAFAQSVKIKSVEPITTLQQGQFFHPVAGPNGQVLFSGSGFKGLYLMKDSGDILTLSDKPGAGYEPQFSEDGKHVYFHPYEYQGIRKFTSLVKKSLIDGKEEVLINKERNFSSAVKLPNGNMVVNKNSKLEVVDAVQQPLNKAVASDQSIFLAKGKIVIYKDGKQEILSPLGEGFYLWPSISPNGDKLLFTKAGEGTFVTSLDGNVLVELGYANAPRWSEDGKWIIYMRDIDDGHQVLESEIILASADGKSTQSITNTDDIKEMYPVWGKDMTVYFGSDEGVIYKAILENN